MANIEEKHQVQQQEHAPPAPAEVPALKSSFTVDTVHHDEAMKVLANYDGPDTWDEAEEKKLRRKIDRRLLPILCITYALQYYDKGEIPGPDHRFCFF